MRELRIDEQKLIEVFNDLLEYTNNCDDDYPGELKREYMEFVKNNPAELFGLYRDSDEYIEVNNILEGIIK